MKCKDCKHYEDLPDEKYRCNGSHTEMDTECLLKALLREIRGGNFYLEQIDQKLTEPEEEWKKGYDESEGK